MDTLTKENRELRALIVDADIAMKCMESALLETIHLLADIIPSFEENECSVHGITLSECASHNPECKLSLAYRKYIKAVGV